MPRSTRNTKGVKTPDKLAKTSVANVNKTQRKVQTRSSNSKPKNMKRKSTKGCDLTATPVETQVNTPSTSKNAKNQTQVKLKGGFKIREKYKNANLPDLTVRDKVQDGQESEGRTTETRFTENDQIFKYSVDADDSFCQTEDESSSDSDEDSENTSTVEKSSEEENSSQGQHSHTQFKKAAMVKKSIL